MFFIYLKFFFYLGPVRGVLRPPKKFFFPIMFFNYLKKIFSGARFMASFGRR